MIARAEIIAIHLSVYTAVRILVYLHLDKVQGAKVADLNCKTEVSLSIGSNGVTNARRGPLAFSIEFPHGSHSRPFPRSRSIFDRLRDF